MYLVPGPVSGFKTVPLGSSAILVEWNKPEQENGIIMGYEIFYRPMTQKEGPESNDSFMVTLTDSNETNVKLAMLKPSTTYQIVVKAITNAGAGESYVHIYYS